MPRMPATREADPMSARALKPKGPDPMACEFQASLLDEIQQLVQLGSWDWDLATRRVCWSDELYRILGHRPHGIVPSYEAFMEQVHSDERALIRDTIEGVLRQHGPFTYDTCIVRPDGAVRYVRVRGKVVADERGNPKRLLGTVQDVTAQRLATETVQERADLLDLSRDAIYVRDFATGAIRYWNQGAVTMYGWGKDEVQGRPAHVLLKTIFSPSMDRIHAQLLESGHWKGTLVQTTKDGRKLLLESRWDLKRDVHGQPIAVLVSNTDVTAEKSLQAQFELMVRNMADYAVYLTDPEGRIQSWNAGAAHLKGYQDTEIVGRSFSCFFTPEDLRDGRPRRLLEQVRTRGYAREEVCHVKKDGSRFWAELSLNAVRDPLGRLVGIGMVTRDLTLRDQFESELRRSEEKFRNIFERASIGVGLADAQGRFVEVNPALVTILGYPPEEVRGQNYLDFTHPDDRDYCARLVRELVEGLSDCFSVEKRFRRKDGTYIWVSSTVAAIPGPDGRPTAILGIIEDITQRKEADRILRHARDELEERVLERTRELRQAYEALKDEDEERKRVEVELRERQQTLNEAQHLAHMGNWEWDLKTNRVTWSDELYRIYGQTPQSFGATFEAFLAQIHPDDRHRVRATVERTLESHEPYVLEEHIVRPDGECRILSSTGRLTLDAAGRPSKLQGTCLDITEYKRVEAEIRRLNSDLERRVAERTSQLEAANKELEAFSYSVSHDLRAPLRSIDGFSLAILEDYADRLDAVGKDYLRRVRMSSQRMAELIDDMLQLSRLTRGELHVGEVDLGAIAADIVQDLRRSAPDRDVDVVIAPGLMACGDPRLLRSVLENLLGNAWKFTSKHPHACIEFGRTLGGGRSDFFVRDDGAGFDMGYADKLFKPFSRLHSDSEFQGTGIGLATVQRIIHRHGGRIWAEGDVEKGATFYFNLGEDGHGNYHS